MLYTITALVRDKGAIGSYYEEWFYYSSHDRQEDDSRFPFDVIDYLRNSWSYETYRILKINLVKGIMTTREHKRYRRAVAAHAKRIVSFLPEKAAVWRRRARNG